METIAQTNVQLYNQLQQQRRSAEELAQVRRAYDLAKKLYSGSFHADGVPFTAHATGVASIVAQLGLSSDFVAAACLHNVYTTGDFGDGRKRCATARRRKVVEDAVGPVVEGHIYRFRTLLRSGTNALHTFKQRIATLTPQDRQLVVIDLADTLENCHDLGPLYYGDNEWIVGYVRREGTALVELAECLGHPDLAAMLSGSIAALSSATISQSLQSADPRQKHARLEIPRSCILRPGVVMRHKMRRLLQRPLQRLLRQIQKKDTATRSS